MDSSPPQDDVDEVTELTVCVPSAQSASPTVADDDADSLQSYTALTKEMLAIMIPTDISSILWMSSQTITMMFVGRMLGATAMAQYSVGIMMFNIFGVSIITGIGSAIDTLASQAFGRNPLSPEIGEVLQRALLVNMLLLAPVTLLFHFVVAPLQVRLFGEDIGSGSALFLKWSPIYLVFILVGATIRRVMLATRAADLVAYANAAAAVASPLANWLFIGLGVGVGATLTLASIAFFNAAAYVALCCFHPKMKCVRVAEWPSTAKLLSWCDMVAFLRLGIPSMIAMCAEWWAFDMQQVFTAFISPNAVAAFGVCMSVLVTLFSIALGIAISCTTLVGNALGANKPKRARQYVRFLMGVALAVPCVSGTVLYLVRYPLARLYVADEAVIEIVTSCFPVLILCHIGDSVQFALQGFFRGVGEPSNAAVAVLVTLWAVGLPSSALYSLYFGLGTLGVFLGLLTGFAFEIPLLLWFMSKWNWDQLAARASQKLTSNPDDPEGV